MTNERPSKNVIEVCIPSKDIQRKSKANISIRCNRLVLLSSCLLLPVLAECGQTAFVASNIQGSRIFPCLSGQIQQDVFGLNRQFSLQAKIQNELSLGRRSITKNQQIRAVNCDGIVTNRARVQLKSGNSEDAEDTAIANQTPIAAISTISFWRYVWLLAALPAMSGIFPMLVDAAQQTTVAEDRRFIIILFLILKRVYLYIAALSIVDMAARRASSVPLELGQRLQQLNIELFSNVVDKQQLQVLSEGEAAQKTYQSLDRVEGKDQALLLPLFLAALLLGSFYVLQLQTVLDPSMTSDADPELLSTLKDLLKSIGPYWTALTNAAVCIIFSRAEFEAAIRSFTGNSKKSEGLESDNTDLTGKLALLLSSLAVVGCYVGPPSVVWPIRNVVNSCLAITVARAIQLPKFAYVVAALGGLVLYDTIGVYGSSFLLPAAGAAEPAAATSVMETVARSKLDGSSLFWQPGLLSVVVNGRTTDALGLGDAIFPALLAGWAIRHDREENCSNDASADDSKSFIDSQKTSWYLQSCLGGYAIGCFLQEVFNTGNGQPALLFLIPSMLIAVLGTATVRGELSDVLRS